MAFDETDLLRVLTGADLRSEIRDNLVSLRWAHVTQLEPLQVRREGEFSDIDVTGTAIPIEALRVGDKVRISSYGAKAFIESSWDVLSRTDEVVFKGPNANDKIREDLSDQAALIGAAQEAAQDAVDEAGQALAGLAETVVSTTLEYVLSTSETDPPAPEAAWSETSPTRTPGTYIWMRVKATRANEQVAYSQPSLVTGNDGAPGAKGDKGDKGDTGSDGAPGAAGVGLESTEVTYAQSTSATVAPTTGWTSTVPTLTKGHYLWTRSVWTYTDTSTETGYSVAYIARDGAHGNDGLPGAPGVGITGTDITYAQSTSGTTAPTSGWQAQPPPPVAGRYVWTKTVWTYSDNSTETGYSVGKIGDTGAKGDKGDTGNDGAPGAAGVGIASTEVTYAQSTSGTTAPTSGWQSTVPTLIKGRYLWTRSVWTYTDTSTETGYSVAYVPQDGADGDDGLPGAPGVGITGTDITYAQSTSGTTAPTSGWASQPPSPVAGRYVWTKTVWTYSDNSTETGYSVGKIGNTGAKGDKGDTGDTGDQGVSVTGVIPYFRLYPTGSGQPPTPSGNSPSGWSTTEPAYAPGQDLWRSERVNFSSGGPTYTTPQRSSAYAAAMYVGNLAEQATQGLVKVGTNDPGHYEGRIWWQTNQAGEGIGIKVSVNNAWVPYAIVADQILVPSSIGPVQIADGAIIAQKLAIGAGSNLAPSDSGAPVVGSDWIMGTNVLVDISDHPADISRAIRTNSTGTSFTMPDMEVTPGGQYLIEFWIKASDSGGRFYVQVGSRDGGAWTSYVAPVLTRNWTASGGTSAWTTAGGNYPVSNQDTPSTWTKIQIYVEIPATRKKLAPRVYLNHTNGADRIHYVTGIRVSELAAGVLIEDGAVTANKITADLAMANKFSGLMATFEEAFIGKVKADFVESGSFAGKTFTGGIFTGSTFRTSNSTQRVQMDKDGLRAYNSSGDPTFNLTGASGEITGFTIKGGTITGGTFQTDEWRAGPRVYIDSASGGRVLFQDANATELMALQSNSTGESEFRIRDYTAGTTTGQLRVRLRASDGLAFFSPTGVQQGRILGEATRLYIVSNERININAKYLTLGFNGDANSEVQIDANKETLITQGSVGKISLRGSGIYQTSTWQQFTIYTAETNYNTWSIRPISIGGIPRAVLQFNGGGANMPQTTIAANVLIDSNGNFYRTSSARRFKNDIRDIGADPYRVLDVPVRDWVDAAIAMDDDSYRTRTPGVVAEEVEGVGLEQFVTYDEDGQTAGVLYDRLPLLLIPVVRDLRDRITRLEEQHG